MPPPAPQIRSLYRSLLRELPARPLSPASPLKQRVRASLSSPSSSSSSPSSSTTPTLHLPLQILEYLRAQRRYLTLLERYNPGMGMEEEERVRLTARRVGMELPTEYKRQA